MESARQVFQQFVGLLDREYGMVGYRLLLMQRIGQKELSGGSITYAN